MLDTMLVLDSVQDPNVVDLRLACRFVSCSALPSDRAHNMPCVRHEPDTMNHEPSDRFGLSQDRCVLALALTARERITNACTLSGGGDLLRFPITLVSTAR